MNNAAELNSSPSTNTTGTAVSSAPGVTVLPSPSIDSAQVQPLDSQAASDQESAPTHNKIGKLPKPLRDLINSMLDDNASAREIIQALEHSVDPPLPYPIYEMNISRWRNNGYRRYLLQQERLSNLRASHESALEMVAANDSITLPEATLQIIASQYYEILADFSPDSIRQKLADDPVKYTRYLSVFSRLTREILNLRKYRDACAKDIAAELKRLDPERELSDREYEILANRFDGFFKNPRRKRKTETGAFTASDPPSPSPTAPTPAPTSPPEKLEPQPEPGSSTLPEAPAAATPPESPATPQADAASDAPAPFTPPESPAAHESPSALPTTPQPKVPAVPEPPLDFPPVPLVEDQAAQEPPPGREKCHCCKCDLPALLPNSKRPSEKCEHCGTTLRAPETLHFYCPFCSVRMDDIFQGDIRIADECPQCCSALPPVPVPKAEPPSSPETSPPA